MKPTRLNLYKIAIVGRPNVGKSTLFNRILKQRKAIIEEEGPTTRDRISALVRWLGEEFELIDTPGLDFGKEEVLYNLIEKQILYAIKEADRIIFVCDAISGATILDHKICSLLRKSGKKITLAVNKTDNVKLAHNIQEFYSLGLGQPLPISALHGHGIGDLLSEITSGLSDSVSRHWMSAEPVRLAIAGKPNSGKSSFVNAVLGEERTTVSDIPGTTRDSVDTYFKKDKRHFIIIDTAGIRSRAKIKDAVTYFSILRAEESIKRSDVAVILVDAPKGVTKEEHKIIDLVQKSQKPFIIAINKWDLAERQKINKYEYEKTIRENVRFMYNAPITFISSLKKMNLSSVIDTAYDLAGRARRNFSTSDLNAILKAIGFNSTRLYSVRQIKNSPPEFEIIAKNPKAISNTDKSRLINVFRDKLGLEGVPVVIKFRKKEFK